MKHQLYPAARHAKALPFSPPTWNSWTCAALLASLGLAVPAQASEAEAAEGVASKPRASAQGEASLPTVQVKSAPVISEGGLGLSLSSTSGSRTGIVTGDLPASLDVVDSETWQERGDMRTAEIIGRSVGMTPLSPTSYSSLSFGARGFTGTNSVGIAEDGVRLGVASSTVPYPSDGWGYERVEVLRGPASIVYGSGTVGATANLVRKQPSREPVREVLLGAGSDGAAKLGLGAAGPLGETLSYRVDAYGHYTNGEHDMARAHGGKLMSTLRWQPSAALRMELLADYSDQKPARYFGTPTENGKIVKELLGRNYNTDDSAISIKDQRVRGRVNYQVNDWLSLSNELYHFKADRYWRNIESYRYDRSTGMVKRGDYLELAHDLEQTGNRLESRIKAGAHQLALGWEVSRTKFGYSGNSDNRQIDLPVNSSPHGPWDSPSPMVDRFQTTTTTHDFYAEDAWTLSPQWLLLAGIRRDLTDMSRRDLLGPSSFDTTLGGTAWRLGLTYKLDAATSIYGQLSQGHDPVGNIATLNLANSRYKLTRARQLELGFKQQFAQGRGEWTAAAYRIEKTDIVTEDTYDKKKSVQGGKQSSQGLELSAVLRLSPSWRLEGNYALVDAQYDELIKGGVDLAGKRPLNVPRHMANLWAHYSTDSHWGRWQASLGARAVGQRYANDANTASSAGYTVWDAALSWRPKPGTTYRLSLRNLTDKLYTYSAVSNAAASQAYPGEGQRVDLSAQFTF
jgi:iron complex outermembrane receptor protein